MKSVERTRALTVGIAVAAVVALTLAGCARGDEPGSSPGITDETVTIGITTPLSGPQAGPGTCTVAGLEAYMGAANAAGGIEFGDGVTRLVEIESMDDAYDPQKASSNYQALKTKAFAIAGGLGTPTNLAWREAANADGVPQVFLISGDPTFSARAESPWSLGWVPTYANEGEIFGKLLAESGSKHRVAILSQNDDFGEGYVSGFSAAVANADNVEIVKELTYEATDTSVDAQLTELAATEADVVFGAMSIPPLVISSLERAQSIGWTPSWYFPSNTSSPAAILEPGGAAAYPGVYSVAFAKAATSQEFSDDPDVQEFLSNLTEYANYPDPPPFPHCAWTYMIGATLEQVFSEMSEPTRENFMEVVREIDDFRAPLMLEGTAVNTTQDGQPAVSIAVVQKYDGQTGFDTVESFG